MTTPESEPTGPPSARPSLVLVNPVPHEADVADPPSPPPTEVGFWEAGPALVPLLDPAAPITPALDRRLSAAARAARAGDPVARNALYFALEPVIRRALARYGRGAWCRGAAWEPADAAQEAFLVFADLVAAWDGDEAGFGPFFLARFRFRLADAVRRWNADRGRAVPLDGVADRLGDGSAAADEARVLLAVLAARLDPTDGAILLGKVVAGRSGPAIAADLGIHPRTVRRRWLALLATLRAELGDDPPPPGLR
ncbi:MAG: hypothetical protein AVDCRST_MAG73-4123 [uncultured Thermomicrobiales bacterium]|uniref:Uncharacterized protein n=1 Tax=uncultured Thermomicrobiales bacterium TaxID=1645740 RepID=A0A6J4V1Q2_9BACT|nr:MAG: hypothetical protein AVDCRST_MAG73-4123 [uncultured Thermomicrobiales bacterium]